jgi:hypothetical protein
MRYLQTAASFVTAMLLLALVGAGGAAATTLEVGGVTKNQSVFLTLSPAPGTTISTKTTDGNVNNTCTKSHGAGSTKSPYSGATVTGPASELSFSDCMHPLTVHKTGTLHVQHIPGTTDGTVSSSGAEWTSYSTILGANITCSTGTGTHFGRLTGTKAGQATVHINVVMSCGFFLPSARLEGTAVVTSPAGLGVSA